MSARDDILARVRSALAGAPRDHLPIDRAYRHATAPVDVVDRFVERVADYRADVRRVDEADLPAALAEALAGATTVVPAGFPWPVEHGVADAGLTDADLDRLDAVVTTATVGIAETGTIVLDHGPGQGRRALTLVPDRHICVIRRDQIVPDVPDAIAALDPSRPQTWISGPSATSDIELQRVEGVHGPRVLSVLLVSPHGGRVQPMRVEDQPSRLSQ
ncbi:MAG: LutC/YkgG family protein [Jatrophihabitans sp.]|uniref:LutC/YkgG family protein n=1 Tax=Jatrophihabitans sp. TaxID=1932789 RepID=UPI003F8039B1